MIEFSFHLDKIMLAMLKLEIVIEHDLCSNARNERYNFDLLKTKYMVICSATALVSPLEHAILIRVMHVFLWLMSAVVDVNIQNG